MAKTFNAKTRAKIETEASTETEMETATGNARVSPSELKIHKVSVCMNNDTYDGIKAIANASGVSVSSLLNRMVVQYVDDHGDIVSDQLVKEQVVRERLNLDADE